MSRIALSRFATGFDKASELGDVGQWKWSAASSRWSVFDGMFSCRRYDGFRCIAQVEQALLIRGSLHDGFPVPLLQLVQETGHAAPDSTVKNPARFSSSDPAPLFEEERHAMLQAAVAYSAHPNRYHWPGGWA